MLNHNHSETNPPNSGVHPPSDPLAGSAKRCEIDPLLCESIKILLECRTRRLDYDPAMATAWSQFYRDLAPFIRAAAYGRSGGVIEPEDAIQEVWLALISGIRLYRRAEEGSKFTAWLAVVVRNRLTNLQRHVSRRPEVVLAPEDATRLVGREEDPADAYERGRARVIVHAALEVVRGLIPETSYRIIFLRWVEGRTVHEIAVALGLSPAQVRDRHRRAYPVLRKLLEQRIGLDRSGLAASPLDSHDLETGEATP